MSEFIIIFVTVGKEAEAQTISRALVEKSIAACVGIVQQNSIYRWKGKVVADTEFLLIIKTERDLFSRLQETVLDLHSYEVPEIISIEIKEGHTPYLDWIKESVRTV